MQPTSGHSKLLHKLFCLFLFLSSCVHPTTRTLTYTNPPVLTTGAGGTRGGHPAIRDGHAAVTHTEVFILVLPSAEYLCASGRGDWLNLLLVRTAKFVCPRQQFFLRNYVHCRPVIATHQPPHALSFFIFVSLPFSSCPPRYANTYVIETHLVLQWAQVGRVALTWRSLTHLVSHRLRAFICVGY